MIRAKLIESESHEMLLKPAAALSNSSANQSQSKLGAVEDT